MSEAKPKKFKPYCALRNAGMPKFVTYDCSIREQPEKAIKIDLLIGIFTSSGDPTWSRNAQWVEITLSTSGFLHIWIPGLSLDMRSAKEVELLAKFFEPLRRAVDYNPTNYQEVYFWGFMRELNKMIRGITDCVQSFTDEKQQELKHAFASIRDEFNRMELAYKASEIAKRDRENQCQTNANAS